MIKLSSYTKFLWAGDYGLKNILMDGVIEVRSLPRPANADAAATGTLLGLVTQNGSAFTAGVRGGGSLKILQSGYGVLTHDGTWILNVTTSGPAGWFRFRGNYADAGGEDTAKVQIRLDGPANSNGGLILDTYDLTAGFALPTHFYLQFRNL